MEEFEDCCGFAERIGRLAENPGVSLSLQADVSEDSGRAESRSDYGRNAMHGAIVMLVALSGLGCQNRSDDVGNAPTAPSTVVTPALDPLPASTTPPPYPRYFPENNINVESGYGTPWGAMRATICSFFLGRDPDVSTAQEIEASVYGYGSGQVLTVPPVPPGPKPADGHPAR
jgi:hypothetical protein